MKKIITTKKTTIRNRTIAKDNPLLSNATLPQFSKIKPQHFKPVISQLIKENLQWLEKILGDKTNKQKHRWQESLLAQTQQPAVFPWEKLIFPLETMNDRLENIWSIARHLNAVTNNPKLRKTYEECLPLISQYATKLRHNQRLFRAIENLARSKSFPKLNMAQHAVIYNELRDFRLAGITLPSAEKHKFMKLEQHLAKLSNKFANNVLDATSGWSICLTKSETTGIPEHALALAREAAERKRKPGWLFTLDFPSFEAVITYADSRKLRQEIYQAYVTRAAEIGPNAGKWDNSTIMVEILAARKKLAGMVYFNNYAEYVLMTRMIKKPKRVLDFLHALAQKSRATALREYETLGKLACELDNIHKLQPWDIPYYSEKLRQQQYAIAQEELRPYFPEYKVLSGLFAIAKKLFGINVTEIKKFDRWHQDVRFFAVSDEKNQPRGYFYLDLYARAGKRAGAWMDSCKTRRWLTNSDTNGKLQLPVAYLICNFNPPIGNDPALFTHREVETLFHEFGHCLHHLLTKINYAGVSGINGVPLDAVELPSQLMERWCFEREAIKLVSEHYRTKANLPDAMLEKLAASRNFLAGMQMLRQIEFALFDLRLHLEFDPNGDKEQIQRILDEVRTEVSVIPVAPFNRMQHNFQHIFGGGYAAGYYSYKCAEVLAADAFSLFTEKGIFDRKTGRALMHNILEQGGAQEPLSLFLNFRGRAPAVEELLKYYGINDLPDNKNHWEEKRTNETKPSLQHSEITELLHWIPPNGIRPTLVDDDGKIGTRN